MLRRHKGLSFQTVQAAALYPVVGGILVYHNIDIIQNHS